MKIFPENWEVWGANVVCSEILDCINKTAPVVEHDTGFRMIRTTNIRNGRIDVTNNRFVEEVIFNKWTRRARLKKNDIILSREAPLGEVGLLRSDGKLFLGQRTMLYRANPEKVDQNYLYYQMVGPYIQAVIQAKGSGSTVAHLRVPDAETLPIPIAPLPIQRKIAAILTAYDDLIETNKRRIALLEKMAEELYCEWFVRMRFPGYQNTKFVKGVPEGWEVARVDSLGKVVTGKTPSTTVARFYGGEYPFIKTPDMHGNMFVLDTNETLTEDGIRSQPAQIIPKNSLCVSCIGTGGIVSITTKTSQTNQQINSICLKRSEDLEWSYYVLKGQKETIQLFGSTGTTMTNLSKGKFSGINFFSPPKKLRNEFHVIVAPIFSQIQTLASSTRVLTQTRDLLLPRLISGKLAVEDLDIQLPPSMREEAG